MPTKPTRSRADQRRTREDRPESAAGLEAVLEATSRLLADRPLSSLSVERIIEEAQISRTAFYWHFSSKFDAVATLHRRCNSEFFETVEQFVRLDADNPDEAVRTWLKATIRTWEKYSSIGRAVHENWQTDETLGEQFLDLMKRYAEVVGAEIDRQRQAGVAPPGPNSQEMATALLWSTQELIYVSHMASVPDVLRAVDLVDLLETIWIGSLYGRTPRHRGP